MEIKVEHRGYSIRFNENSDEWSCFDVQTKTGRYAASPSLSKVKAAIDKMLLDVRKANAFPCFEIGQSSHHAKLVEALITEYVQRKVERDTYGKKPDRVSHIVAAVATRYSNERASRKNDDIRAFMPDTEEARAAYDAFEQARERRRQAEEAEKAAFEVIPRVTVEMIPELVGISENATAAEGQ